MIKHLGSINIETDRLILRRLEEKDLQDFHNNLTNDPTVSETFMIPYYDDIKKTEVLLKGFIERCKEKNVYLWAMERKDSKEVIGIVSAHNQDEVRSMVEIGYAIGIKHRNKGYATEALKAAMDFFFNKVGFNRIECGYFLGNVASARVMQKANMKFLEIRNKELTYRDKEIDTGNYYLTKEDYNG